MNKAEQIWGAYAQSMQQQNDNWKNLLADDVTVRLLIKVHYFTS